MNIEIGTYITSFIGFFAPEYKKLHEIAYPDNVETKKNLTFGKEKKELSEVYFIFLNSLMEDCKNSWEDVKNIIRKYGFELNDEIEGGLAFLAGIFSLDVLHSYQKLGKDKSDAIYQYANNTIQYMIEELKQWPPKIKELYDFFCYIYLTSEEEYLKNPEDNYPHKFPPFTTASTILTTIILGFKNYNNLESELPYSKFQKLLDDFIDLIFLRKNIELVGRWEKLDDQYIINY